MAKIDSTMLLGLGALALLLLSKGNKEPKPAPDDEQPAGGKDAKSTAKRTAQSQAPAKKQEIPRNTAAQNPNLPNMKQLTSSQQDAISLSQQANVLFGKGDFEAAIILDEVAIGHYNDPLLQYNLARSREELAARLFDTDERRAGNEAQKALDAYRAFIEMSYTQSVMADKGMIAALKKKAFANRAQIINLAKSDPGGAFDRGISDVE